MLVSICILLVDLCSQNIQNNSLIATLKYTVDNCAKTNLEKHKVNQGKWLFRDFLVIYEWVPICSVFEYSVLVGETKRYEQWEYRRLVNKICFTFLNYSSYDSMYDCVIGIVQYSYV